MSDHKQVRGAGGFPVICSARVEELIVGHASFLLLTCYVLHGYGFCVQHCIGTVVFNCD